MKRIIKIMTVIFAVNLLMVSNFVLANSTPSASENFEQTMETLTGDMLHQVDELVTQKKDKNFIDFLKRNEIENKKSFIEKIENIIDYLIEAHKKQIKVAEQKIKTKNFEEEIKGILREQKESFEQVKDGLKNLKNININEKSKSKTLTHDEWVEIFKKSFEAKCMKYCKNIENLGKLKGKIKEDKEGFKKEIEQRKDFLEDIFKGIRKNVRN